MQKVALYLVDYLLSLRPGQTRATTTLYTPPMHVPLSHDIVCTHINCKIRNYIAAYSNDHIYEWTWTAHWLKIISDAAFLTDKYAPQLSNPDLLQTNLQNIQCKTHITLPIFLIVNFRLKAIFIDEYINFNITALIKFKLLVCVAQKFSSFSLFIIPHLAVCLYKPHKYIQLTSIYCFPL